MYISIIVYVYMHMCTHIYMYICMYLYILIDVCIRIYPHTLNIGVCYEYTVARMGTQLKYIFKEPLTAQMTEDMKKPRGCEGSFEYMLHPKDTNCIFCLFSFFLKKENGRRKTPEISQSSRICWKEDDLLVMRNLLR